MNPERVVRERVRAFTDLPNVGSAMARDFRRLGFAHPHELAGADPLALYLGLCRITGSRHDPCVLDVFMSVTDFLAGNPPRPWWHYTAERKARYGDPGGDRVARGAGPGAKRSRGLA